MEPDRYRDRPELFTLRKDRLNERLAFVGLHINDKGQAARNTRTQTLDEATRIANAIRDELQRRKTHLEVLRYCSVEVLNRAHFHACFEATKSTFDRLRTMTGVLGDGAALSLGKSGTPALAINSLRTQTEKDERTGFANLVKGLGGLYRNPAAHDPRINRSVSDEELLEVLTLVAMVHRRLEEVRR